MRMARLALTGIVLGALVALPLAVPAQQTRVYQLGVVLHKWGPYARAIDGLRDGLKELGFQEGQQFLLSVREAKGD